jgi:hypothetical protein
MITEIKKIGGGDAEVAALEYLNRDAGSFVSGDKLEEAEIAAKQTELEQVVRQLEIEVDEYIQAHKSKDL